MLEALRRVVQRMHYPLEVMLVCVALVRGLPAEHSKHRGDDGRARRLRRSLQAAPLVSKPMGTGLQRGCLRWKDWGKVEGLGDLAAQIGLKLVKIVQKLGLTLIICADAALKVVCRAKKPPILPPQQEPIPDLTWFEVHVRPATACLSTK